MPTYEFKCGDCRERFDIRASFSEKDKGVNPKCPRCGSEDTGQVFGGLVFFAKSRNTRQITQAGEALLEYTGPKMAPITVCGPTTGKDYRFSKSNRIQRVKEPDVSGLIQAGAFRRYAQRG